MTYLMRAWMGEISCKVKPVKTYLIYAGTVSAEHIIKSSHTQYDMKIWYY
jgi:hypothetical protein